MKLLQHTYSRSLENDEAAQWISVSDLMAGLVIIFILTLTYYMLSYSEKTERLTENQKLKQEIMETIEKEMREKGFKVTIDKRHWVIRMPDELLFDSGSAKLKEKGKELTGALGSVLYDVFTEKKFQKRIETVFIEGHTDHRPLGKKLRERFRSNWELSAQRAINTWRELTSIKKELENLVNNKNEKLFSVSGYADSRGVVPKDSENLQKNRRIDLRIAMSPPTKERPKKEPNIDELLIEKLDNMLDEIKKEKITLEGE